MKIPIVRFIAHIVFGLSVGICLSNGFYGWSTFDFTLMVVGFGFLLSAFAEFCQAWNYTSIYGGISKDIFEFVDVLKNWIGCILGMGLFLLTHLSVWFGLVPLFFILLYAIIRVIQRKHI